MELGRRVAIGTAALPPAALEIPEADCFNDQNNVPTMFTKLLLVARWPHYFLEGSSLGVSAASFFNFCCMDIL